MANNKEYAVTVTGMAAVDFACILTILSQSSLTIALKVSLYSFAASLPFLIALLLNADVIPERGVSKHWKKLTVIMVVIGILGCLVGISAIFFHFSFKVGLVFLIASIISTVLSSFILGNRETGKPEAIKQLTSNEKLENVSPSPRVQVNK